MELTTILELMSRDRVAGDEMTTAFLEDAVATFSANPAGSTSAIRQLRASDPSGFVLAAVRLLTSAVERSAGVQYIAGLMFSGNVLIDALLDDRVLHLDAAVSLARNLALAEPLLDVRLVRKMLADAGGDMHAVKAEVALRVLALMDAISDCSRLACHLTLMMRHANPEVRCEAAFLLSQSNFNLNRIKTFVGSESPLLRSTAMESLWGHCDQDVLTIFREASLDANPMVRAYALVGLIRAGDTDAYGRMVEMSKSGNPIFGIAAAWARGDITDAAYAEGLAGIVGGDDVKAAAERRLRKLRLKPSKKSTAAGTPPTRPSSTS